MCDWQEERLRRGDDLRLQMAIEESKREKLKPEEVCVKSAYIALIMHLSIMLAVISVCSLKSAKNLKLNY